jgi:hypothetical protein
MLDVSDPEYPHAVPHLFPTNEMVNNHNAQFFARCTTEKAIVKAVDCVMGDLRPAIKERIKSKIPKDASKTAGLMYELQIAVDMRYETIANISVEDGITNGAGCVVKKIQYLQEDNPIPSVIWVLFDEPKAGQQTRSQYKAYFRHGIHKDWTPLFATKRNFNICDSRSYITVMRTQFPIRPAAAKTIHKAQGDTMDAVVVSMGSTRPFPHSHYVALSRVTKMAGLHILDLNERKIHVEQAVNNEIHRLQSEACMQLCYTPMYSFEPGTCTIVFQNARSLHKHFSDLSADHNITASDIITVAESRLKATDSDLMYTIEGFTIHRNDQQQSSHNRPPHGQVLYIADHCEVTMILPFSSLLFEYSMICLNRPRNLQIVTIYKSPACDNMTFRDKMLTELLPHIDMALPFIIVGDFNFNLFEQQETFLTLMDNSFHCQQYINQATTTSGSLLDSVFANFEISSCDAVYCAWSDHKTITVVV